MIRVENLSKSFDGKPVLSNISLEIPDGTICGLYGSSGIGKTTLAKILCGVLPPDSGSITLDGEPLFSVRNRYDRTRGIRIQMVCQQPHAALDPRQRIGDGFRELIRYHHFAPNSEEDTRIDELLGKVGLRREILGHFPHQISGGEAQRVSIARALLFRPSLLILDEATSMLDVSTQANVLGMARRQMAENGGSILLISHDRALVQTYCQLVYEFDQNFLRRAKYSCSKPGNESFQHEAEMR